MIITRHHALAMVPLAHTALQQQPVYQNVISTSIRTDRNPPQPVSPVMSLALTDASARCTVVSAKIPSARHATDLQQVPPVLHATPLTRKDRRQTVHVWQMAYSIAMSLVHVMIAIFTVKHVTRNTHVSRYMTAHHVVHLGIT